MSTKNELISNFIELNIFSFFSLSFISLIFVFRFNPPNNNVLKLYSDSWNSSYIVDIKLSDKLCQTPFISATFGIWSGIKGCYCYNNLTGFPKAKDSECLENDRSGNNTCSEIRQFESIPLKTYKNFFICVKYSNKSFKTINEEISKNNSSNLDLGSKFRALLPQKIMDNPIIDIKIVNSSLFDDTFLSKMFNKTDYEKFDYTALDNTTITLFVKRLKIITEPKDVEKLIINIKLFNELWCSFNDIAFPSGPESNDIVDYGFDYCNNLSNFNNTLYFDNYQRTESINFWFDNSLSKKDFYNQEILNIYQNITKESTNFYKNKFNKEVNFLIDGILKDQIEPRLLYERYFTGLICNDSSLDYSQLILNLDKINSYQRHLFFIFLFHSVAILVLIIYCFIKCYNNSSKLINLLNMILLLIASICFVICFLSLTSHKKLLNDLTFFQNYCQMDNSNSISSVKINQLEISYLYYLDITYKFWCGLLIILFVIILMLIFSVFKYCCSKEDISIDDRQIFELSNNIMISN